MTTYAVRYVHKIKPLDTDVGPDMTLTGSDASDSKTLGAALRKAGVLISGGRVRSFRVEPDSKIVVFPSCPGLTTYWHAIILTPKG